MKYTLKTKSKTVDFEKHSIGILLSKMGVAACFFFGFSLYILAVQFQYDATSKGFGKSIYFALILFGGGISYDCAKAILCMRVSTFKIFGRYLVETFLDILFVVALCAISAIGFSQNWKYLGQISYLFAIVWMWHVINSATKAIEATALK